MHVPPSRRWRALCAVAVALALLASSPSSHAAEGPEAARQHREEVRRQRAALAARLDVLTADKAEVDGALDVLEGNVATARAQLTAATGEADAARAQEAAARNAEAAVTAELDEVDALVRELAIGAFIGGGSRVGGDIAMFMSSKDAGEAARAGYLAAHEVERQDAVVDRLARTRAAREAARIEAEDAATRAARLVEDLGRQAAAVEEARALQAAFVAEVEAELERRLSEAAGLEQLDQALSEEIRREEAALAARLAAEAAERVAAEARRAAAELAAIRPVQHGPATGAPRSLPVGAGTLVRVGTFVVDASIGEDVAALLAAAAADGLVFGGGAFRDPAAQVERRRANCGPTDHDLYEKPASACHPPTARPGHSMHERGLAIDFTLDGALIGTRSNPGYVWLAEHAGRFGLRNLPSEPWHWSTTGG